MIGKVAHTPPGWRQNQPHNLTLLTPAGRVLNPVAILARLSDIHVKIINGQESKTALQSLIADVARFSRE